MNIELRTRTNWLDALALILLVFLVIDLALFGPGIVLPVVGVSARRLIFVGIFGLFILRHVLTANALTMAQLILLSTIMFIAILWAAAVPAAYGFAPGDSLADVLPWTSLLLLVFWPWDAWPVVSRWMAFAKFIVRLSLALAVIHIVVWALLVSGFLTDGMLSLLTYRLTGGEPVDNSFIRAGMFAENQFRVYWSSSVFMLCGLYFHVVNASKKWSFGWVIAFGILAFGLWTTQIRAFLGAAVIFVVLSSFLRYVKQARLWVSTPAGVLFMWAFFVLCVSAAIRPELLESIGLSRDASDVVRVDQADALLAGFTAHPILGMGFGAYASSLVRSDDSPFSYELVFYALLMKVGLLGVLALGATLFISLNIVRFDRFALLHPLRHSYWVAFTTGIWFAGGTNPFVVNFVGMSVLMLLFVDARYFSEPTPRMPSVERR
jgi:hypothetical protein